MKRTHLGVLAVSLATLTGAVLYKASQPAAGYDQALAIYDTAAPIAEPPKGDGEISQQIVFVQNEVVVATENDGTDDSFTPPHPRRKPTPPKKLDR